MEEKSIVEEYSEIYRTAEELASKMYAVGSEEYKEQKQKCVIDMLEMYLAKHGRSMKL